MKFSHPLITHISKTITSMRYSVLVACLFSVGISSPVNAAPGQIEDSPLFLANRAEPNIFFMVDDSGSMDIEMMTTESVFGWGGAMLLDPGAGNSFSNGVYIYLFGEGVVGANPDNYNSWNNTNSVNSYDDEYILPTQVFIDATYPIAGQTPEQLGTWRGRNTDYNKMYYDPTKTYQPWIGLNDAGNAYPDYRDKTVFTASPYTPTSIPVDPYYSTGATYNLLTDKTIEIERINGTNDTMTLTPAAYWVWRDSITNTLVDPTDSHARVVIAAATSTCAGGLTETKANQITNTCMLRSYNDEIRNFTNWFVYHRKRDYVGKYAMSQVISPAEKVRMGMAIINNGQQNSNIRLQSMSPDVTTGNKATLLDGLFRMNSAGSTPLRQALQRAGNYYACSGGVPNFTNAVGGGNCGLDTSVNTGIGATESAALCQQNFTVLITDGERNGGSAGVGNVDDTSGGIYTFGTPPLNFSGYEPYADDESNSLADVAMHYYSRDLSGLANQVPTTCGVDENPAQHMVTYTVGFGVSGDVDLANLPAHPQRGYTAGCTATVGADFAWSTGAINTGPELIDDLVHAAHNGRGQYLSAQDADGFTAALGDALRNIASRTGSASAVALNSSTLSTGSVAYFARFSSATWQGEFSAYPIVNNAINFGAPLWNAHTLLEAKLPTNRAIVTFQRATAEASKPYGGMAFRDFSLLPAKHQNDLMTLPAGGIDGSASAAAVAQTRLDFLRGDHACEISSALTCSQSKTFRNREFLDLSPAPSRFTLGDIINSSTVFVGSPLALIPSNDPFGVDGKRYRDFKNGVLTASYGFSNPTVGARANTRTEMLYVGSNDGMLHAFNANTGDEVWAYIPGSLFQTDPATPSPGSDFGPGLHTLTEQGYEHRFYVDLTPKVADAYVDIGGSAAGPDWHTVLVGGLRAGGRGYFAIDITDPDELINIAAGSARETALANRVMWEFTTDDDRDLGFTFSEPQLVPIGDSGSIEWYVVFGNGYKSLNGNTDYAGAPVGPDDDPYVVGSNTHSSKLFILKLEGPTGNSGRTWVEGTDYWKIDTQFPAGTSLSDEDLRNSMATPALADSDGDSIADTAYAGDYEGNMWAFEIAGTNTNNWDVYKSGNTPKPLFVATDAANGGGNRQAITAKPSLIRNNKVNTVKTGPSKNIPNLLVGFGTGSYISQDDLANTDPQSFYQVWDRGPAQATLDNGDLTFQGITTDTGPLGDVFRVISPETLPVNYTIGGNYGWYHNLPTSNERVINEAGSDGTALAYITIIPSVNPCSFGGTSWLMLVDAFTGTALTFSPYDIDNNGIIDSDDVTAGGDIAAGTSTSSLAFNSTSVNAPNGAGTPGNMTCPTGTIKKVRFVTLSDGTVRNEEYCSVGKRGRNSWREINF